MDSTLTLVIVFYNPTPSQVERVQVIANHYKCIVVDNSSTINTPCHTNVTYIPLLSNKGIAYAQNIGIQTALKEEFEYVCFVDQDSSMSIEMPKMLLDKFVLIRDTIDNKIGAIGPTIINEDTGLTYRTHADAEREFSRVEVIISSGTVIPISILRDVSFLDSTLFIDYVDHDLCFKLRDHGLYIYSARDIQLKHKIGKRVTRYLGQEVVLSAPFRYYYIYRNILWLCRRNYVPFKWKIKNLLMLYSRIPLMLFGDFYSNDRKAYLYNTLRGIIHGLFFTNKK